MFALTYSLLWAIAVAQALAICFLVRQIQEIRQQVSINPQPNKELAKGSAPPSFYAIEARTGERVASSAVLQRGGVLLILSPECSTCRTIVSGLSMLPPVVASNFTILCQGTTRRCQRQFATSHFPTSLFIGSESDIAGDFRVRTLPAIVTLDAGGRIAFYSYPKNASELQQYLRASLSATHETIEVSPVSHAEMVRVASGSKQ